MTTECHWGLRNLRECARRWSIWRKLAKWKVCRVFVCVCVWWLKSETSDYNNILNTSPSRNRETSPELNRRHKISQIGWEQRRVKNSNKSDGAILANDGIKDETTVNKEWSYKKNGSEEMGEKERNSTESQMPLWDLAPFLPHRKFCNNNFPSLNTLEYLPILWPLGDLHCYLQQANYTISNNICLAAMLQQSSWCFNNIIPIVVGEWIEIGAEASKKE